MNIIHKIADTIVILIGILIIVLIINVIFQFTGIPFGKTIAKHQIKRYLNAKYENNNYQWDSTIIRYDFLDTHYNVRIYDNEQEAYVIYIYYWRENTISDSEFSVTLSESLNNQINSYLAKDYPEIKVLRISFHTLIKANQKFGNKSIDELKRNDKIDIILRNKNDNYSISKEQFADLVVNLITLLEDEFRINRIFIHYTDKNDINSNSYKVTFRRNQLKLSKEEIIKMIEHPFIKNK